MKNPTFYFTSPSRVVAPGRFSATKCSGWGIRRASEALKPLLNPVWWEVKP